MSWTLDHERAWNRRNPFRCHLGIEVNRVGKDGDAEIALPVTEELLQAYGMVHGGIYCVLIDTVLGTCARAALQRDCGPMTVDLNVSFLRPTGLGRVVCRGDIIKAGRSVVVGAADVVDADGRKLATGRGSFLLRERDAYRAAG